MTNEYINELLEKQGKNSVLLEDCVLSITEDRCIIYSLSGDTDYSTKDIEICYADNHSDIIFKGIVNNKEELDRILYL